MGYKNSYYFLFIPFTLTFYCFRLHAQNSTGAGTQNSTTAGTRNPRGIVYQNSRGVVTQNLNEYWFFRSAGALGEGQKNDTSKINISTYNGGLLPATVPGDIQHDLLQNKLIPDIFHEYNKKTEKAQTWVDWVEKSDWEYQTSFAVNKTLSKRQNISLMLDGLDTYARVYLNDSLLLKTNDMFMGWSASVKKYIKPGKNTLRIYFESALNHDHKMRTSRSYPLPSVSDPHAEQLAMYSRKASYQYGWESGPRFLTCGIWKPVYLVGWNEARIRNVYFKQHALDEKKARMTAIMEVEAGVGGASLTLDVLSRRAGLQKHKQLTLHAGHQEVSLDFDIDEPQKWWPNGMGRPVLYDFKCALRSSLGQVLDSVNSKVGLRTVELVSGRDTAGNAFYFKVNGLPLYAKGANVVPLDHFPAGISTPKTKKMLKLAADAHMNMLRVWGGGLYESDAFYEEADRLGLLVWQDFMFSSAMYPGDSSFLNTVQKEIEYTVKRLRNHPSLALWCGNNQIEQDWLSGMLLKGRSYSSHDTSRMYSDYKKLFRERIPQLLRRFDPGRSYVESSPFGNGGKIDNKRGDMHFFASDAGLLAADSYTKHVGRFMSAFGQQPSPNLQTRNDANSVAEEQIDSGILVQQQRRKLEDQITLAQLVKEYPKPRQYADYLYESQLMQAEAMKVAIEAQRRSMSSCMGSLYWRFNECWPGGNASAIDYYGRTKPLYYFGKRAFSSILLSLVKENDKIRVHIISDQPKLINADLKIQFMNIEGDLIMQKKFKVTVFPNQSRVYYTDYSKNILKGIDSNTVYLKASLISDTKEIANNILYFCPVKNIELEEPELSYQVQRAGEYFWLTVKSFRLAKNIYLDTKGAECEFSDNYFDLMPGESKSILIKPLRTLTDLGKVLKIQTLNDLVSSP